MKTATKTIGITIIAVLLFLIPTTIAVQQQTTPSDTSITLRGGLGIHATVTNNGDADVVASYWIIFKLINLTTIQQFGEFNVSANSVETLKITPETTAPAVVYCEIDAGGVKVYKYGLAFLGIVLLPWSDE